MAKSLRRRKRKSGRPKNTKKTNSRRKRNKNRRSRSDFKKLRSSNKKKRNRSQKKLSCRDRLAKKISYNIKEYNNTRNTKNPKFVSRSQAIAVSFSQMKKLYPNCKF